MEINPLELTIADLPKDLEIEMPEGVSEERLAALKNSISSQVLYNSRSDDKDLSSIEVEVLRTKSTSVLVRVRPGN